MNKIIAIPADFSHLVPYTIFRGKSGKLLKVEFDDSVKVVIREKLVEATTNGTVVFRKPGETSKTSAELIKEGRPPKLDRPQNNGRVRNGL